MANRWAATLPLLLLLTISCSTSESAQEQSPMNGCRRCLQLIMPQFADMVAGAHTSKREMAQMADVEDDLGVAFAALPEDEYYAYQESNYDTTRSMLAARVQEAVGTVANLDDWVVVERDSGCGVQIPVLDMHLIVTDRPRCLIVDFVHRGTSLLQ